MDKYQVSSLAFYGTTKCTLKCKLCATGIPYIKTPVNLPKETLFLSMERAFQIWTAEHVDFLGGEPLLHPQILEIMQELYKYNDNYGEMRIVTNGTIMPGGGLLDFAEYVNGSGVKLLFLLDNYGRLSGKLGEIKDELEKRKIPYRQDDYTGDSQRFNGWVDYGEYKDTGRSDEEISRVYYECIFRNWGCIEIWNGKAYPCAYTTALEIVNGFKLKQDEYVDLFDDTIATAEKIRSAKALRGRSKPFSACRLCNGISPNSPRFPAAEQLL